MSFEDKVNEAINGATAGEDGKLVYAEGVSEEVQYMSNQELRRRDTQSALSKSTQAQETLTSENNLLAQSLEAHSGDLTEEQAAGLEELKHSDPDAWRKEVNKLEITNREAVKTKRDEIKAKAKDETELERRTRVLDEYNTANPEAQLTDDIIANDIPPRITNAFKAGELTFDEFLAKATGFIKTPKVITEGSPAPEAEPDLGKAGGGAKPDGKAVSADIESSYKDEIY